MCTFRIWLSWPRLAISAFRFSGNGSRKLANQHSFLRSALAIWVSACLRSSSALQFPPPNSHLKPPGRCPISASRFLIKVARHRKRCGKLLPATGVIWALRAHSWKRSPKMSSRALIFGLFFQLWARKAQMIPVAGLGNPNASGKNHCGNFRSSAPQPPRNINGQPWNSWRFPSEAVFLDDFPLSPPPNSRGPESWKKSISLERLKISSFRLKFSISLENFNLAWFFQSWPSELPTKIGVWWVARLKFSISLENVILIRFNLAWKFQSRRAILNFFKIWALRDIVSRKRAEYCFEGTVSEKRTHWASLSSAANSVSSATNSVSSRLGWEELTEVAPRNSVSPEKLTGPENCDDPNNFKIIFLCV